MSTAVAPQSTYPSTDAERREVWLADRRTAITGTDVAGILGLSKFASPIDVYLEKVGEAVGTDQEAPQLVWGRRMERTILEAYAVELNAPIVFAPAFSLERVPTNPLFGATLDAHRGDTGEPVDAKNKRFVAAPEWGASGTDQIPLYYVTQLMLQMMVRGKDRAHLAVLVGGNEFRSYTVNFDPETAAMIVDKCTAWWEQHVVTRTPPTTDGSPAFGEFLKRRFASHTDRVVSADPALREIGRELIASKTALGMAEKHVAKLEQMIKVAIGDNLGVDGKDWSATWRLTADSIGTDFEALAFELWKQNAALRSVSGAAVPEKVPASLLAEWAKIKDEAKWQRVTKKGGRRFLIKSTSEEVAP